MKITQILPILLFVFLFGCITQSSKSLESADASQEKSQGQDGSPASVNSGNAAESNEKTQSQQPGSAPEPSGLTLAFCDKMSDTAESGGKRECYLSVAQSNADTSVCDKMGEMYSPTTRENCYESLATYQAYNRKDQGLCEKYSISQAGKDECYKYYATAYSDPSACEKVQDEFAKESCLAFAK